MPTAAEGEMSQNGDYRNQRHRMDNTRGANKDVDHDDDDDDEVDNDDGDNDVVAVGAVKKPAPNSCEK